jgi:hypothetical protein
LDDLVGLFVLVLLATRKRYSPKTATTFDYSAIDGLCEALALADRESLSGILAGALLDIIPWAVQQHASSLFRLLYGLIDVLAFRSKGRRPRLLEVLEALSPKRCPAFSVCWLQLVMHDSAFPRLEQSSDPAVVEFCVGFIKTCVDLCVRVPEVFHRGVTRILLTIASTIPRFFVSYHAVLVAEMPTRFTQFRNIVLGAEILQGEASAPPVGFSVTDALEAKSIKASIDSFGGPDAQKAAFSARFIASLIKGTVSAAGDRTPKLVWQLAIYCAVIGTGKTAFPRIGDLCCTICGFLDGEAAAAFLGAIVDNLRYPNAHTRFASDLLFQIFEKGNDGLREVMLVVLFRRILCVTPPPRSVRLLVERIVGQFGGRVNRILGAKGESALFRAARLAAEGACTDPL